MPAAYARTLDGHAVCDLCPHACRPADGRRGLCGVREARRGTLYATAHGRLSAAAADPIEKKPLYHFFPGAPTLSFGGFGCNFSCRFCQNAAISRPPTDEWRTVPPTDPADAPRAARARDCRIVSFTYNEPIVNFEWVTAAARACRAEGLETVAVTAGYIQPEPRAEFFAAMSAANVDLKSFREDFYRRRCGARLQPALDTLVWLRRHTNVWLELTTLLIPGENDDPAELDDLAGWVRAELGPDTPLHFSGFFPAAEMRDRPPTPPAALRRARERARAAGLRHVYVGNCRDPEGETTWCAGCGAALIERDGFAMRAYRLTPEGRCPQCAAPCPGRWANPA